MVSQLNLGFITVVVAIVVGATQIPVPLIKESVLLPMPVSGVWDTVRNVKEWHSWNRVFDITFDSDSECNTECFPQVGDLLTITCRWLDGTTDTSHEVVTQVSINSSDGTASLCWLYVDLPQWLLSTDRCITLYSTKDGGTRLVNHEQFGGPLAWLVYWLKADVVTTGFSEFNRALRAHVDAHELETS